MRRAVRYGKIDLFICRGSLELMRLNQNCLNHSLILRVHIFHLAKAATSRNKHSPVCVRMCVSVCGMVRTHALFMCEAT